MGIKDADRNSVIINRGRVHCPITVYEGGYPNHVGINFTNTKPKVHCTVFEDNEGAIEIANVPKMRPRTKHLNLRYHHFREEVKKGTISIYHVSTKDQMADIFTKPLDEGQFTKLRMRMIGW